MKCVLTKVPILSEAIKLPENTRPTDTEGGVLTSNYIQGEVHTVTGVNSKPYRILIPLYAPFYLRDLKVVHKSTAGIETELQERHDYNYVLRYMDADRKTGHPVYGGIEILNDHLEGTFIIDYRMIGDPWVPDRNYIYDRMLEQVFNRRTVWWDQLTNVQDLFPVTPHPTPAEEIEGHQELLARMQAIELAILQAPSNTPAQFTAHILSENNPHNLTKGDIDLDNVQNLKTATDAEVVTGVFEKDDQGNEIEKYITHRQARLLFIKLLQEQ